MTTLDPTKLAEQLRALLAKATPQAARERGESLTLRARHFGDSTEITTEHTADTVALLDDGFPNHEAVADLFVAVVNALPALLTRPTSPPDVAKLREALGWFLADERFQGES